MQNEHEDVFSVTVNYNPLSQDDSAMVEVTLWNPPMIRRIFATATPDDICRWVADKAYEAMSVWFASQEKEPWE